MRVLFWTDWFLPSIGGVEVFSARLLPALVRRGHEITVVAGHHQAGLPEVTDFMGVTVQRFAFHPVLAAHNVERVAEVVTRVARLKRVLAPDLIHLNTLGPSVLFHLQTLHVCQVPILLTMHSPIMPEAVRLDSLYGRALRATAWVNCNSRAVHAELCRLVPELRDRSSVTYYGMDVPALEPSPRPRHPVVLAYGRLVEDKGFDLAVRAFAAVARRFPGARLVIAGAGAARDSLEHLAETCGVAAAVNFMGAVPPEDIPALIDSASVVVVPSRWAEPFGLVALEAALMARPVVAAGVGGLVEVVEHGTTGLVVPPEDPDSLAAAVIALLADPESADRMGWLARQRARERFGWERCVDEYEHLYERSRALEGTHA